MNNDIPHLIQEKILNLNQAAALCRQWKQQQKRVVFTNGVFDILHAGHVQSLSSARAQGHCLIVGLNADTSVKKLKGSGRPIISQTHRATLLAALFFVDAVVIFEEETPLRLITTLLPDVLVKSADYNLQNIVGAPEVIAAGGRVQIIPIVEGLSTTHIITQIQNQVRHQQ